jgi:hypothetical protein
MYWREVADRLAAETDDVMHLRILFAVLATGSNPPPPQSSTRPSDVGVDARG